jgi:hypothetical protein
MNIDEYSSYNIDNQSSRINSGSGFLMMTGSGRIPVTRGRAGRDLKSQISNFKSRQGRARVSSCMQSEPNFLGAAGALNALLEKKLSESVRLWARESKANLPGRVAGIADWGIRIADPRTARQSAAPGAKQSQFGGFRARNADRTKTQTQFARRGGSGVRCVSRSDAIFGDSFKEG